MRPGELVKRNRKRRNQDQEAQPGGSGIKMKKRIPLMILFALAACTETFDSEYKDLAAVKRDGAIQRGLIPSWLPSSAYQIKETHNIDTNKSILAWKYEKGEIWQVPKSCGARGSGWYR